MGQGSPSKLGQTMQSGAPPQGMPQQGMSPQGPSQGAPNKGGMPGGMPTANPQTQAQYQQGMPSQGLSGLQDAYSQFRNSAPPQPNPMFGTQPTNAGQVRNVLDNYMGGAPTGNYIGGVPGVPGAPLTQQNQTQLDGAYQQMLQQQSFGAQQAQANPQFAQQASQVPGYAGFFDSNHQNMTQQQAQQAYDQYKNVQQQYPPGTMAQANSGVALTPQQLEQVKPSGRAGYAQQNPMTQQGAPQAMGHLATPLTPNQQKYGANVGTSRSVSTYKPSNAEIAMHQRYAQMRPPAPNAQQITREDPRMQAMRNLQQRGIGTSEFMRNANVKNY